jgi:hypothetical protein
MVLFIYLGLRYECNNYSNVVWEEFAPGYRTRVYITTNYRVLYENNWLDDLKYLCEPTEYHEKRITVKFICDRGVSHEFVRHRVFSFAQESTRQETMAAYISNYLCITQWIAGRLKFIKLFYKFGYIQIYH